MELEFKSKQIEIRCDENTISAGEYEYTSKCVIYTILSILMMEVAFTGL